MRDKNVSDVISKLNEFTIYYESNAEMKLKYSEVSILSYYIRYLEYTLNLYERFLDKVNNND